MPREPKIRYCRTRAVREERMDDLLFIIDQEGKAIHAFEPLAAGLWSLLAQPQSAAEIKTVFKQAFPNISARRVASDIADIITDLEDYGLIGKAI